MSQQFFIKNSLCKTLLFLTMVYHFDKNTFVNFEMWWTGWSRVPFSNIFIQVIMTCSDYLISFFRRIYLQREVLGFLFYSILSPITQSTDEMEKRTSLRLHETF